MKPPAPLPRFPQDGDPYAILLGSFLRTGELPAIRSNRAAQVWTRKAEHNAKAVILFCDYQIHRYRIERLEKDELYDAIRDSKKYAHIFLRKLKKPKGFPVMSPDGLAPQYDTLSGSIGQIFLLAAFDLAKRAEEAL